MYPFVTLPVPVHTVIPINRLDLPVKVSTALYVNRYTCSSVYLFSLFLHFQHNMHSYLSTHLLGYVHTDPHASPLPKNKYLPVTTTTCVPALKCTLPFHFHTLNILYDEPLRSTRQRSTALPVHRYIRS